MVGAGALSHVFALWPSIQAESATSRFRNELHLQSDATRAYFEDLRLNRSISADSGAWHLDVVRDLKRVNTHLVAASAYPILERQGELLPSRIAADD